LKRRLQAQLTVPSLGAQASRVADDWDLYPSSKNPIRHSPGQELFQQASSIRAPRQSQCPGPPLKHEVATAARTAFGPSRNQG